MTGDRSRKTFLGCGHDKEKTRTKLRMRRHKPASRKGIRLKLCQTGKMPDNESKEYETTLLPESNH